MAFSSFLPEESDALAGLDPACKVIFYEVIVTCRNRKTGICKGVGVTWPDIQKAVYVAPRRGIRVPKFDKSKCKRLVAQLESVGLIRRVSTRDYLVFECLIFNQYKLLHYSNQIKSDPKPPPNEGFKSTAYRKNTLKADPLPEVPEYMVASSSSNGNPKKQCNNHANFAAANTKFLNSPFVDFFISKCEMDVSQVNKPNVTNMFARWEALGFSTEVIMRAVLDRLRQSASDITSPMYFNKMILEMKNEKNKHGNGKTYQRRESHMETIIREAEEAGLHAEWRD